MLPATAGCPICLARSIHVADSSSSIYLAYGKAEGDEAALLDVVDGAEG